MKNWKVMCGNVRSYPILYNAVRSCTGRYIFDEVEMPETCGEKVCTIEFRYYGKNRISIVCTDPPEDYSGSDEQIRKWLEEGELFFSSFDELGSFLQRFNADSERSSGNDPSPTAADTGHNGSATFGRSFRGHEDAAPAHIPPDAEAASEAPVPPRPQMSYDRDSVTLPGSSSRVVQIDKDRIYAEVSDNIYGQEQALRKIIYLISNQLGTKNRQRPASIFLYGPPGTGKSDSIKQIVDTLNRDLKGDNKLYYRPYDCTQLQTKGDITRLIGAAPSYVGFDEPGVFSVLEDHPNTVFVFEEVEKAAANCTEVIMQAMETGKLETNGKTLKNGENFYDLSKCIIFFTSNIQLGKPKSLGFGQGFPTDDPEQADPSLPISKQIGIETAAAKKQLYETGAFRREVISRMTAIVKFDSLKGDAVKDIAAKCIRDTAEQRHLLYITSLDTELFQGFLNEAAEDINSFGVRTLRSEAEFFFDDAFREYASTHPDHSKIALSGTLDNIIITPVEEETA